MKHVEVFEPLLKDFCAKTNELKFGDIPGIFIPHTMPNYDQAKKKIFYFGRDTNGWTPASFLKLRSHEEYIECSSKWLRDFGFLEYNQNKSAGFWTLVIKLHLRLKGITEDIKIGNDFLEKYKSAINDFGWGNTNSIEVAESIIKRGQWDDSTKKNYPLIKEYSKNIDILKHTIDAYKPELIFIFNWLTDEAKFLQGLEYESVADLQHVKNKFWIIKLKDYNTHIIWTAHPNNFRFIKGQNVSKVINTIMDELTDRSII